MVLNPHRYAAALDPREDRHARAGCLMAATFFLPLLANKLNSVVLFSAFFIYIGLIVPLLLSYITLGSLFHGLKAIINLDTTVDDEGSDWKTLVMFFMLAEKYFCPKDRLACLYALLFYTILAYLKKSLKPGNLISGKNVDRVKNLAHSPMEPSIPDEFSNRLAAHDIDVSRRAPGQSSRHNCGAHDVHHAIQ
ncbi:unnamed protein product [Notodromas monacha]|uniref:Uncharacterized protein n=1 Tax=Notodromas monacha TaxID=399045 RepID=A0A7R9GFZ8_9CRUS|nr:unnamed protein product [Notodromas monacha]CAG0919853.1 unnamed protein product [Notodromas monacha]